MSHKDQHTEEDLDIASKLISNTLHDIPIKDRPNKVKELFSVYEGLSYENWLYLEQAVCAESRWFDTYKTYYKVRSFIRHSGKKIRITDRWIIRVLKKVLKKYI